MELQIFNLNQTFELESGKTLPHLTIGYHTFGQYRAENVVWVCHAFSGNSNPHLWWAGLFGEGKTFDAQKHFIVCANILGSCYGSTNPLFINPITGKPYGLDFPIFTIRDMVKAHILLRNFLGIEKIKVLIGPSLGGFQALEWALMEPERIEHLIAVATNAKQSPWAIAFNETQRMALQTDCTWGELSSQAAGKGVETARAIAMLSYRSYHGYNQTQSDPEEKIDDFRASSYQRYQGHKFKNRFNAYSYWYLSKAMDSHDLGRNRGSLAKALNLIKAKTHILAIRSDILYPLEESRLMAKNIKDAKLEIFDSQFGHDGFLVSTDQIAAYLSNCVLSEFKN